MPTFVMPQPAPQPAPDAPAQVRVLHSTNLPWTESDRALLLTLSPTAVIDSTDPLFMVVSTTFINQPALARRIAETFPGCKVMWAGLPQ